MAVNQVVLDLWLAGLEANELQFLSANSQEVHRMLDTHLYHAIRVHGIPAYHPSDHSARMKPNPNWRQAK